MNRLTNYKQGRRREPSKKLVETKYMPCNKCDYIYCDECVFQIHTNRLASYEDAGFEPEQVKQLNDAFTNSQKKLEKAFDDLLAYKDLEEQLLNKYNELQSKFSGDGIETYTTGYRAGHKNGQIELLEWILNIDTGCRQETGKALEDK